MKSRYCVPVIVLCFTFPLLSMWKQVSGQIEERALCRVNFESTAIILCDKPDNRTITYYLEHPDHPFISEGLKPYQSGNGGLLNSKLLAYDRVAEPVKGGVQVTVRGIVETEGIAPFALNATGYGQHFNDDPAIKVDHETGLLEDVILGALKERSVDRGISDLTDYCFNGGKFLKKYIKIIKAEWTSHLSDDDDGKRSPEQNDMIKRYFPRKAYWPSMCHVDQLRRSGRKKSDTLSSWNKDGAKFNVILDTFKIDVERVGMQEVSPFAVLFAMIEKIYFNEQATNAEEIDQDAEQLSNDIKNLFS